MAGHTIFPALPHLPFDSGVFGFPFYRANTEKLDALEEEIGQLFSLIDGKVGIDAKVDSSNFESLERLDRIGFNCICKQVTCEVRAESAICRFDKEIVEAKSMSSQEIAKHSANFTKDRLSLDPNIPVETVNRFYEQWIRNAFSHSGKTTYVLGAGFCITMQKGDTMKIDLVSVLEKRRGIGSRLILHALHQAKTDEVKHIHVTTEAHNEAALRLYEQVGFQAISNKTCLHLFHDPARK